MRNLFLIGLGTAGAVGAFYFLDAKNGAKRRKQFKKQFKEVTDKAGTMMEDYSHRMAPRAQEISRVVGERAVHYGHEAKILADGFFKNGSHWTPSARLVGAMGSALAFYGAGRTGASGTILRTLSLGLFTRALMSSR